MSQPLRRLAELLILLSFATRAHALQPLITDDTETQGAGGRQIEIAWNVDRIKDGTDTTRQHSLPLTYTWGATEALDLFLTVTPTRLHEGGADTDTRGLANSVLGAKWRFHEDPASKTSYAVKPEIVLPVSRSREAAGLGAGKSAYNLTLIATRETSFGEVHLNLATGQTRNLDTAVSPNTRHTRVSVAPVWAFTEHFKLVADAGQEWQTQTDTSPHTRERFFEIGTLYAPQKNLIFALGLIHRRDNQDPQSTTRSATLGVTWRY